MIEKKIFRRVKTEQKKLIMYGESRMAISSSFLF